MPIDCSTSARQRVDPRRLAPLFKPDWRWRAALDALSIQVAAIDAAVRVELTKLWESRADPEPPHPISKEDSDCRHSDDFTSVVWFGKHYTFTKGQQAHSIELMWGEWELGLASLSQEKIAESIGAGDSFSLRKVFRSRTMDGQYKPHPAWRTMIRSVTKGTYGLYPPKPTKLA
jgi:hypothetical protein